MTDSYSFSVHKFKIEYPNTVDFVSEQPIARSGHRVLIDGYNVYSFGGFNPAVGESYKDPIWNRTRPQFSEVWKYNIVGRQWTRVQTLCKHPGLASPCLVQCGKLAIMFGGTVKEFHESANNELSFYDLHTNTWSQEIITSGAPPRKLYGQGIITEGDRMFVIGGTEGFMYSLDVHVLDLVTKKWTFLRPTTEGGNQIPGRYRHELIKYGTNIYVIGGGTSSVAYSLSAIPTLDLDSVKWKITNTSPDPRNRKFPKRRKCHVALRYKHYLYVHGGHTYVNGSQRTMAEPAGDFWRLDLETLTWEMLPSYSNQRLYFHSGAISKEGCLYIFGGVTTDHVRTNQIERVWLNVPSLKAMAMEALHHYFPFFTKMKTLDLLNAGIPRYLVKEIKPLDFK